MAIRDEEVLQHFKLTTKDAESREATDLMTDDVKQLVSEGMSPVWYVEETWLDTKYGPKGAPKPFKAKGNAGEKENQSPEHQRPPQGWNERESGSRGAPKAKTGSDDIDFLTNQIQMLEQEKHQERERHDTIVAKLFEQLAVKDQQISAWDDLTQGLTRALATGQLTPVLPAASLTATSCEPVSTVAPEPANRDDRPDPVVDVKPTTSTKKPGSTQNQVSRSRKRVSLPIDLKW